MSRRVGQNGNVFVKSNCKLGRCEHKKSLCPKYGRYWQDVSGRHERRRVVIPFGEVTQSVAERKLREHIEQNGVNSEMRFIEVTSPSTTFRQQAGWWLDEIRSGRIVSRKRARIKAATIAGYESAVNWLNPIIGNLPLAEIKNEAAKHLVSKMRSALSDKTTVNYFQVVRAVIASAVSEEGEPIHPRNWNYQFIGLPIVDEREQAKPTLTTHQVEQIIAGSRGRYKVLFALLAGSGMRIGEALGLRVEHLTDDYSTIKITQSAWRGKTQSPKTANATREIDLHSSLAAILRAFVNGRREGYLFSSSSGRPLTARNVIRDGFDKFRIGLQLTQPGLGFHAFRRFRTSHLRKNRAPWDLEKFWLGHANKSVTDKYSEQLKQDVEWRKAEAERIVLGFSLTAKPLVGLLGQPEANKSQSRKAA
jgi:integrase